MQAPWGTALGQTLRPYLPAAIVAWGVLELITGFWLSRRLVQELLLAFVRLDLAAVALVRRLAPPRYEVVGACQRRGACCTQIVAEPPQAMLRRPRLLGAFVFFHRLLHNFHVAGRGPRGEVIFRCGFVQTDGRCGIYRYRPRLCRVYPVLPFFAAPKVLPGCGYQVKLRGMRANPKLRVVNAVVGVHHPTPPRRRNDGALEHAEDFRLVDVSPHENVTENPPR